MRGRRVAALTLAAVLGLSGCNWMDGSYVSVTPHQVGLSQTVEGDTPTVSSYVELRSALVRMVDEGSTEGRFILLEYPRETAMADLERAMEYVTESYPIGAYTVESIEKNLGANAVSVDITYRHTRQELDRIRTVRGMESARQAVADALDECAEQLVLQISGYRDTDFTEMVQSYAWLNPDRVMEVPYIDIQVCPDQGDTRVVELRFDYMTDRETLRSMRQQVQPVFSSAALYVTGQGTEQMKFSQLHAFLMERFDYTFQSSRTPAYSLLCEGIGDSRAFAQVYAAMCSRIGLEAMSVSGTKAGEKHHWNLVQINGVWYHLDLLGVAWFEPMADAEMVGYEWDREAYPSAG